MKNLTRFLSSFSLTLVMAYSAHAQDVFKAAPVGIGTVNPAQALDVNGSIKFSVALMPNNNAGLTGNIFLSTGASATWLANSGTPGLVLQSTGTAAPTWVSANSSLTTSSIVNGGVNSVVVVTNGTGQVVGSSNVILDVRGTLNGILYGQGTGNSALFTAAGTSGQALTATGTGAPVYAGYGYWNLTGNSGTNPAVNFVGTTNNEPLVFETEAAYAGQIDAASGNGNTYMGAGGDQANFTLVGGGNNDAGQNNVAFGDGVLGQNTTGIGNVAFGGYFSLILNTTGNYNVALGRGLESNYQGNGSIGIGFDALWEASGTASYNIGIGYNAGYIYTDGQSGSASGLPNAIGNFNTAVGYEALYINNVTNNAVSNTAIGNYALFNTTGKQNTAMGDSTLLTNVSGNYNTALGYFANVNGASYSNATAIGFSVNAPATNSVTLGNSSVAYSAITGAGLYLPGYKNVGSILYNSTNAGLVATAAPGISGQYLQSNSAGVPTWASVNPASGSVTTVTGTSPIIINGTWNVNIQGNSTNVGGVLYSAGSGTSALFTSAGSTGQVLTSTGTGAPIWAAPATTAWTLTGNAGTNPAINFIGTTDDQPLVFHANSAYAGGVDPANLHGNTYFGYAAGNSDGGTFNVAVGGNGQGTGPLGANSGNYNVAFGWGALKANSSGSYNVAFNRALLNNTSGTGNIGFGFQTFQSPAASYNIGIGYQAGYGATTVGYFNTIIGYETMSDAGGGVAFHASNTALGSYALFATSGSRNTAIGDSALRSVTSGINNTGLGYFANVSATATNATAIGYAANATTTNTVILGNGTAFVGINTSSPQQLLEVGGSANTIRNDGLANGGSYDKQITSTGNIVYVNNTTGDLYSLPNGTSGQVLSLNTTGVPTWITPSNANLTRYNIVSGSGSSVVVGNGTSQVVGSGNVTLDIQGAAGGVFYGQGIGTPAGFTSAGVSGQVLTSAGTGAPVYGGYGYWNLTGNAGTNPAVNFFGTTNDEAIRFYNNSSFAGSVDPQFIGATAYGSVYLGTTYTGFAGVGPGNGDQGTGSYNVGLGNGAMADISGLTQSVSLSAGWSLLTQNTGTGDVAIGYASQRYGSSGNGNTGVGSGSLYDNSTSNYNTAIGIDAMAGFNVPANSGSYNGAALTGTSNTAVGYNAFFYAPSSGATSSNTAIGTNVFFGSTSGAGNRNTFVGDSAFYTNTTGSRNTALGYFTNGSSATVSNTTVIGYKASAPASNSITLGNSSVAYNAITGSGIYLPGYNTEGSLLYTGTNTGLVASTGAGTSGNLLQSNGPGQAPTWANVTPSQGSVTNITTTAPITVAGTWNLGIQGTNLNQGGVLYSNGSAGPAAFTSAGTSGEILESTGAGGAPVWAVNPNSAWLLTGNAGTNPAVNAIGTTNDFPLVLETYTSSGTYNAGVIDPQYETNGTVLKGNVSMSSGSPDNSVTGEGDDAGTYTVAFGCATIGSYGGTLSTGTGNISLSGFIGNCDNYQGNFNISITGYNNLRYNYNGSGNIAVGEGTLSDQSANTSFNTAIGINAGIGGGISSTNSPSSTNNSIGNLNTAIGNYSLAYSSANIGAASNTAIGNYAATTTTASRNTAIGDSTLYTNTSGTNNTALGFRANNTLASATNSTVIGYAATTATSNSITLGNSLVAYNAVTGSGIYLPGYNSPNSFLFTSNSTGLVASTGTGNSGNYLESNGPGQAPSWANVTFGSGTVTNITGTAPIVVTGNWLVGIQGNSLNTDMGGVLYSLGSGASALFSPTPTAAGMVLVSGGSGTAPTWAVLPPNPAWNITGNSGTTPGTDFIGTTDAKALTFKVDAVSSGTIDLPQPLGNGNAYLGEGALASGNGSPYNSSDAGTNNVAMGYQVYTTAGNQNVVLGYHLLASPAENGGVAATGANNVAIGFRDLYMLTTGTGNTFAAPKGAQSIEAGSYNTGFGYIAFNNGNDVNGVGNYNVGVGYEVLEAGTDLYASNTAIGNFSMEAESGIHSRNTAVGSYSLNDMSSGTNNVAVGDSALFGTVMTGTYNAAFGFHNLITAGATNATTIGAFADDAATSNIIVLGSISGTNGASAYVNVGVGTTTPARSLEIGGTANTIRVDGLASGGTYNQQLTSKGNIVYVNNTTGDLYSLPNGATGQVLTLNSNGVPSWGASVSSSITKYNVVPGAGSSVVVGNGTGQVVGSGNVTLDVQGTAGGVFYGNGVGSAAAFTSAGSTGNVLISQGTGVPIWGSASSALTTYSIVNGGASSSVVVTNGANQVVGSGNVTLDVQGTLNGVLLGQGTGTSAVFTSAGTSGQVLSSNGTAAPTWAAANYGVWNFTGGNNISPVYGTNFIGTLNDEPIQIRGTSQETGICGLIDPIHQDIYFGGDVNGAVPGTINSTLSTGPNNNVAIGNGSLGDNTGASYGATVISYNVMIGYGTGYAINSATSYSTAVGDRTLRQIENGINTSFGYFSLSQASSNVTGATNNDAFGYYAENAHSNNSLSDVAVGDYASDGTSSYNTAVGYYAVKTGSGSDNTGIGYYAAEATSGAGNTAIGYQALLANTSGTYNMALGYSANVASDTLTNATAIGYNASAPVKSSITLGNTAATSLYIPGYKSVYSLYYTSVNTGLVASLAPGTSGYYLESNGTGTPPTWASLSSLHGTVTNVTGTAPITIAPASTWVVGIQGSSLNTDKGGVLYSAGSGTSALFTSAGTSGEVLTSTGTGEPTWAPFPVTAWKLTGNTGTNPAVNFIGTTNDKPLVFDVGSGGVGGGYAGTVDPQTGGNANVYLGGVNGNNGVGGAGNSDAGTYNVALGFGCLGTISSGKYNVALGSQDGSHINGNYNITAGGGLFFYGSASGVTALGSGNFNSMPGNDVTAIGSYPMQGSNSGVNNTTLGYNTIAAGGGGASNTAIGSNSLLSSTTSQNTAVGDSALVSNSTGEYNTAFGYNADVSNSSLSNATVIGYKASAIASNSVTLGNALATKLYLPSYSTANSLLYTSAGTGLVSSLAPGTSGQLLTMNTSGVPAWASVSITQGSVTNIIGVVPIIVNGTWNINIQGTGANEGGVLYSAGSGTPALFTPAGTVGQFLETTGTGAPTWVTPSFLNWALNGNSGTVYGTNYLGTNDDNGLQFEVNGNEAGLIEDNDGGNGGNANTGLGFQALYNNYSNGGTVNTAMGYNAMLQNTNGFDNVAFGYQDLYWNYSTTDNTALGYWALPNNDQTGDNVSNYNTAIGSQPLLNNYDGTLDDALGYQAMYYNYYGSNDVGLGAYALYYNDLSEDQTAFYNTAVGYNTLTNDVDGYDNTVIGANADETTFDYGYGYGAPNNMTAIGANAQVSNSNTVYLGTSCSVQFDEAIVPYNQSTLIYDPGVSGQVLYSNGTYDYWGAAPVITVPTYWTTAGNIGTSSPTNFLGTISDELLQFQVGSGGVGGGYAGTLDPQTGGNSNVYMGAVNGNNGVGGAGGNDGGSYNVGFGFGCLGNTSGSQYNVALGNQDASHNDGSYSVTIGCGLFFYNSASGVTALGAGNFNDMPGNDVTAIGYLPIQGSNTGVNNTVLGYNAFAAGGAGRSNTAVGTNSLHGTTVSHNTAVGDSALYTNTTGTYNTAAGYGANVSSGTLSNATAVGAKAYASTSNTIVLGEISSLNGATANTHVGIGTNAPAADAALAIKTGHLETQAASTAVTAAAVGSGVTGATVTLPGSTDVAGTVNFTVPSSGGAIGAQVTVTFAKAYTTAAPKVLLTPANASAAAALYSATNQAYVTATTSGFTINFAVAPTAGATLSFNYFVMATQ